MQFAISSSLSIYSLKGYHCVSVGLIHCCFPVFPILFIFLTSIVDNELQLCLKYIMLIDMRDITLVLEENAKQAKLLLPLPDVLLIHDASHILCDDLFVLRSTFIAIH